MRFALILSSCTLIAAAAACGNDVNVFSGSGGGGGQSSSSSSGSSSSSSGSSSSSSGTQAQCDGPGQCMLASATCCGVCGMPTLDDMVAINQSELDAYTAELCASNPPCPGCASQPNPNLMAYCDSGQCVAADITNGALTECQDNTDCRLRWGLECCECGAQNGGLTAIAVAAESKLMQLVCDPAADCPACVPSYPADAAALCDAGHCIVTYWDNASAD